MDKIALVSCVKKKQIGLFPAKDIYVSQWFIKAKQYVEQNYQRWYILSAKYCLLNPEMPIKDYELSLFDQSLAYKKQWSTKVLNQLKVNHPIPCQVDIYAGNEYRKYIVLLLESHGYVVNIPMRSLGIGQQLKWLKERGR